jgi:chemotaxis protein methyltransferase CheR
LKPGGYLFLGHAETLRGLSNDFHLRHTHQTFYYQRRPSDELVKGQLARGPSTTAPDLPTLVDLVNGADSWVEAIRRASERIEALTSPKQTQVVRTIAAAKPAWDISLALELLRQERFAEALELVDAFPPESQHDPGVLLLRAVLLTHSSQFAKAEQVCQRLLELDELNGGAHYLLALCREGSGDRAASTAHDLIAVYLDPAFAMPRLHLGLLARRAGDRAAARRELGQALVLLQREDASRLLMFGGGFGRHALVALCRAELLACGGRP